MTPIRAVLFDLDDTLYPQSDWLDSAWHAVADRGATVGLVTPDFETALRCVASEGSDRGTIIDRALTRVGRSDVEVGPLVAAFLAHRPEVLAPYPGVVTGLKLLAGVVPLAVVTDGTPTMQRAKLEALGLQDRFAVTVVSDELGRRHRKPDPLPILTALRALGIDPADAVLVGDRPDKDGAGAASAGVRFLRVRTGEYSDRANETPPWRDVDNAGTAMRLVDGLVRS